MQNTPPVPPFIVANVPLKKNLTRGVMQAVEIQDPPGEGLEPWDDHIVPLFNHPSVRVVFGNGEVKITFFLQASTIRQGDPSRPGEDSYSSHCSFYSGEPSLDCTK